MLCGRRGDLQNEFSYEVNQINAGNIMSRLIYINKRISVEQVEEMQVEVFGVEVKIENIELSTQLYSSTQHRKLLFAEIEIY